MTFLLTFMLLCSPARADDALAVVTSITAEQLEISAAKVKPDKPLSKLGADDLDVIEIILKMERALKVSITEASFGGQMPEHSPNLTVSQLAAAAEVAREGAASVDPGDAELTEFARNTGPNPEYAASATLVASSPEDLATELERLGQNVAAWRKKRPDRATALVLVWTGTAKDAPLIEIALLEWQRPAAIRGLEVVASMRIDGQVRPLELPIQRP